MARCLQLPVDVCNARPITDTYSLGQGQGEFYFVLLYEEIDIALCAHNHGVAYAEFGRRSV
jgi:NAD+ synthase